MPRTPKPDKPSKTEALAIRLDPKVKYGLEILARQQRRSITSVVEWIINEALKEHLRITYRTPVIQHENGGTTRHSWDEFVLDYIWDSDEVMRLIKLTEYNADLLTYEENQIWNLIQDNALYWVGKLDDSKDRYSWDTTDISSLRIDLVRHDYPVLKQIANSEIDKKQAEISYFPGTSVKGDRLTERIFYIHSEDELDLIEEILPLSTGTKSEALDNILLEWASKMLGIKGSKTAEEPEKDHGKEV